METKQPSLHHTQGGTSRFELFGWGAGGAEKIQFIVNVLQDLGINNIATLVDGDKLAFHNALKKELPILVHGILPTGDIRDKDARPAVKGKTGICTSSGDLKPEYEDEVIRLINELGE